MGLNELVLKVPASEARPPAQPPTSSTEPMTNKSSIKKKKSAVKTHSRESSGASNVSVKFSVNDETVTTTTRNNPRSSEEDITMRDRLSQDLEEEIIEDDEFHQRERSKSCESIPHDRLTPYLRNGDIR